MLVDQVVCCDAVDLLSSLEPRSVGAVITDPPFFISMGREQVQGMGGDPWDNSICDMEGAINWTSPVAAQTSRILRPGGALVVMGGSQSLAAWELCASRVGLNWMAELTVLWNTGKPRARNFGSLSTSIRWYVKPGSRHSFNSGERRSIYSNVLVATKVPLADRIHPAQKPVELTNFLVSLLTKEEDLVVDPYCGAGTTLVSAALCGRRWLGSDNNEKFAEIANKRAEAAEFEESNPLYLWVNGRLVPIED